MARDLFDRAFGIPECAARRSSRFDLAGAELAAARTPTNRPIVRRDIPRGDVLGRRDSDRNEGNSKLGLTDFLHEGVENLAAHHRLCPSRSQFDPTAERPLEASLGQKVPDRHHDTLPEHPDRMPSMVAASA
jgi:hypothetical protein